MESGAKSQESGVMHINYMVKVKNAKLTDIQKALQQAGIEVRSIIEVHKEEERSEGESK